MNEETKSLRKHVFHFAHSTLLSADQSSDSASKSDLIAQCPFASLLSRTSVKCNEKSKNKFSNDIKMSR